MNSGLLTSTLLLAKINSNTTSHYQGSASIEVGLVTRGTLLSLVSSMACLFLFTMRIGLGKEFKMESMLPCTTQTSMLQLYFYSQRIALIGEGHDSARLGDRYSTAK